MKLFKSFIIFIIIIGNTTFLGSQNIEIPENLQKLLLSDGVLNNHLTIGDRSIEGFRNDLSEIPLTFWDQQKKEIDAEYKNYIQSEIILIYEKYLSETEINETIKVIEENRISDLNENYIKTYQEAIEFGENLAIKISQQINRNIETSSFLKNSITAEQCEEFKIGNFINIMGNGTKVKIDKTEKVQISSIGDNFIKFEINYINDCDYSLKIIETTFEHLQNDIGNSIKIFPYESKAGKLKYKSIMAENGYIKYGEIIIE